MMPMHYLSYTDTIVVNGTPIFYVVEGRGKPVVLLHGNGGSHNDLETTTHQLAQSGYQVYALDSRGQGCNPPLPEYHYYDMAEDVFQFINALHLDHPAVFGWSDGGIIALQLELYNPGTVSLLAVSGANIDPLGIGEEAFQRMCDDNPHPSPLVKMMIDEPHIAPERLARIQCPVLVCAGQYDIILEEHTRLMADSLPQGELCIVPDADHGSHIYHNFTMGHLLLTFFKQKHY